MTSIEKAGFERFIAKLLRKAAAAKVETAKLARQGYDVDFLYEMAAAYAAMPPAYRQYAVTFDRTQSTLRIVRAARLDGGAAAG